MVGRTLCAWMILLLFLTGCGGEGGDEAEQMALDARGKYLSMTGFTATVELTADYGDRVFPCTLAVDHTAGSETVLTIQEPEILRGVIARLKAGESLLEFDGVAVDTGPLAPEGLSPVDCIPYLLQQVQGGFLSQWGFETLDETETLRLTTSDPEKQPGEGTETVLWIDRDTFALRRGEILVDGVTVMQCVMTDFQWKT